MTNKNFEESKYFPKKQKRIRPKFKEFAQVEKVKETLKDYFFRVKSPFKNISPLDLRSLSDKDENIGGGFIFKFGERWSKNEPWGKVIVDHPFEGEIHISKDGSYVLVKFKISHKLPLSFDQREEIKIDKKINTDKNFISSLRDEITSFFKRLISTKPVFLNLIENPSKELQIFAIDQDPKNIVDLNLDDDIKKRYQSTKQAASFGFFD